MTSATTVTSGASTEVSTVTSGTTGASVTSRASGASGAISTFSIGATVGITDDTSIDDSSTLVSTGLSGTHF